VFSEKSDAFPVPTLQIAYSASMIQDISPTGRQFQQIGTPTTSTRTGRTGVRTVFSQTAADSYFGISGNFAPGSYTKTGWVYFTQLNDTYPHILSGSINGDPPDATFVHLFWILPTGTFNLRADNTATNDYTRRCVSSLAIQISNWYFVATVYDSTVGTFGRQTIYVYDETFLRATNQLLYTSSDQENPGITPTDSTPANYSLFIGGFKKGESTFRGSLDDVRLYNRALTPQQIEAIYLSV
jgi:hypothetical protein